MNDRFNQNAKGFKEITWIPVKNISVAWQESQRPLNKRHAAQIAENFDPEMFGVLAVTKPNGQGLYHVIDGQHRRAAVEELWGPNEQVPCQVFDAEDPARAAELFDEINTRRRHVSPVEIFRVRLAKGSEVHIAVDRIVRSAGFHIGGKGGKDNPNELSLACVDALMFVYQSYGAQVLGATLALIHGIWGNDRAATSAYLVRGIGSFVGQCRGADLSHLRDTIAKHYTPNRLIGAAKAQRELAGGNVASMVRDLMITIYNRTAKRGQKIELKADKLKIWTKAKKKTKAAGDGKRPTAH